MPVLWTFTSTSSGPIEGTGSSLEPEAGLRLLLDEGFHGSGSSVARIATSSRSRDCDSAAPLTRSRTRRPPRRRPRREVDVLASAPPTSACGCARAPFGTTGKKKPATIDAALVERLRQLLRQPRVAQHHRNDRRLAGQNLKARLLDAGAKSARMRLQERAPVVGRDRDLERLQRARRRSGARASWRRDRAAPAGARDRRSACAAATKPPMPPPSVLPNVPVTMSTRSPAPVSAGVPRPFSPRWPVAWQSSTSTSAP